MNKKILKINSLISISIGTIIILLDIIFILHTIFMPLDPNSWGDLAKLLIIPIAIIFGTLCSPLVISGIETLNYLKGEDTYKSCMAYNIISIIFNFLFLCFNLVNKSIFTGLIITFPIILICCLIINSIGLYKEKKSQH